MLTRLFRKIYNFLDKYIIVPISRFVYYLNKGLKKNQGKIDKILNRPHFLIYLSLIIAAIMFVFIDSKVINLVETDSEVITNVPVKVKYNEEAYVIEGVPDTVDIIISGRKSDIYLAKQLGEYEVILDLSEYKPSNNPYKVYFTYSKSIKNLSYKLNPEYVQVTVRNKESLVMPVTPDILNVNELDSKLSVKSVSLKKTEVVVKGSSDALDQIASVKALIDLGKKKYTDADTYDLDNVELAAYNSEGIKMDNIEIVPGTIGATLELESYSVTVPLSIETTGDLIPGKSIASILINGNAKYSITIYGEKSEIDKIKSVPISIDVDGLGNEDVKTYNLTIGKPNGVRYMSTEKAKVQVQFGEEQQKTIDIIKNITPRGVGENQSVTIVSKSLTVNVKGVAAVLDEIEDGDIAGYIDIADLKPGEQEVEVKIENTNPLINYVVSGKITIIVS